MYTCTDNIEGEVVYTCADCGRTDHENSRGRAAENLFVEM
jgi:hypothetical protein